MTVTDGPPGLEVVHRWNGFELNDLAERPSRIRLQRIQGWQSHAELDSQSVAKGWRGAVDMPAYRLGKTIVYEGVVQGKTLSGMRAKYEALKKAMWDINTEGQMDLMGATEEWFYNARVAQFDGDEEQANGWEAIWPFQRGFTLGFFMADSRKYYASPTTSPSTAVGSPQNLNNQGSVDTDPVFTVTGVLNGQSPMLYNGLLLKGLKFLALPAGNLVVNFKERTAFVGATDVSGYIDEGNMDWWQGNTPGLVPGIQACDVTGSSGTWTATFYHASE